MAWAGDLARSQARQKALKVGADLKREYPALDVEVAGCWLWVRGTPSDGTLADTMKSRGLSWAKRKRAWVLPGPGGSKRPWSLPKVFTHYNAQALGEEEQEQVAAA